MTFGDAAVSRADRHDLPTVVHGRGRCTMPHRERLQPALDALRANVKPTL